MTEPRTEFEAFWLDLYAKVASKTDLMIHPVDGSKPDMDPVVWAKKHGPSRLGSGPMPFEVTGQWCRVSCFDLWDIVELVGWINQRAAGLHLQASLDSTFRHETMPDGTRVTRRGFCILVFAHSTKTWIPLGAPKPPPRRDPRFEFYLDPKGARNYGYHFEWVGGQYTLLVNYHNLATVEAFKALFPEFPSKASEGKLVIQLGN